MQQNLKTVTKPQGSKFGIVSSCCPLFSISRAPLEGLFNPSTMPTLLAFGVLWHCSHGGHFTRNMIGGHKSPGRGCPPTDCLCVCPPHAWGWVPKSVAGRQTSAGRRANHQAANRYTPAKRINDYHGEMSRFEDGLCLAGFSSGVNSALWMLIRALVLLFP